MGRGCSRMLPKRLLPERPGATSSQPGDLLHIPASREVAILLLASSRAGLPPGTWAQGSAGHRIPLTFSLTCLWPSAQLTCPPPATAQTGWSRGTWRRWVRGLLTAQPGVLPGVLAAMMRGSPVAHKSQWRAPGLTKRAGARAARPPS